MYTSRTAGLALILAIGLSACSDAPAGPPAAARPGIPDVPQLAKAADGSGIVLDNLTGVSLPLIGRVGNVVIDQAIITELIVVEDLLGNIIGVEAEGVLRLTGGVLGSEIVTEDFTTRAQVLSSGQGQCDVVNIDLAPVALDALGRTVAVDVPQTSITPRASGAVGPLLCALGSLLNAPIGQVTSGVRGIVNAINRIII